MVFGCVLVLNAQGASTYESMKGTTDSYVATYPSGNVAMPIDNNATTAEGTDETVSANLTDIDRQLGNAEAEVVKSEVMDNIVKFYKNEDVPSFDPAFGVRSNLLYDIAYVPDYGLTSITNIGFEYYPRSASNRLTYNLDIEFPMWRNPSDHKYMQIYNYTFSMRRYSHAETKHYKGFYTQAYVHAGAYGIGGLNNSSKGKQGEGIGAGLGIGYKIPLSRCDCNRRWYLDLGMTLGVFYTKYDPYIYGYDGTGWYYYDYSGSASSFHKRSHGWLWAGPTRVYFSIGYNIFNRANKGR